MQTKYMSAGLIIALLLSAKVEADVVVASNLPATQVHTYAWEEVGLIAPNYNNYNNVSKGQSFIPQHSGNLTTVDALISLGRFPPAPGSPPLNISIYTSNAGIPIAQLGTVQRLTSDFTPHLSSSHTRETIDFSELEIPLLAGDQYMVVFHTPFGVSGTHGGHSPYLAGYPQTFLGLTASQARNGIYWEVFPGHREIAIEVRAIPIPEPGASTLAVLVIAVSALNPRRRFQRHCRKVSNSRANQRESIFKTVPLPSLS
jgi:hypothetical protein